MGLVELIIQESSIFKEPLEQAVAEARAQGRAEGRAEAYANDVRHSFRRVLKKLFPELESLPEIDAISDPVTLFAILDLALDSNSADVVRQAILDAVPKSN